MDQFRAEAGPALSDDALACPAARARWFAERAELLKRIAAEDARREIGRKR